jgi:UDPglucose--hexose-1-phosphate uridylyltransferase
VIRTDPLTGHEVIVAPGRRAIGAARPAGLPTPSERCPFCPGHEADSEETLLALGEPWQVRVVGNRYPLVEGAHEVLIEHRAHDLDLPDYDPAHARLVLEALVARTAALEARPGVRAVLPFRNRGRRAGSSQPHPHSQLVALDAVPARIARAGARLGTVDVGEALAREAPRHVLQDGALVAYAPRASERAFHLRIAGFSQRFAALDGPSIDALARLLPRLVQAVLTVSGATDYNLLVTSPPVGDKGPCFIDVLPRTGGDAGFELASGATVCVVDPDQTASELRAHLAR